MNAADVDSSGLHLYYDAIHNYGAHTNMNPAAYEEQNTIRWNHTDTAGNIRLSMVAGLFEETAAAHIEKRGVGFEALQERGEVWVLSRMYINITRYPSWGETVTVRTWPKGVDRLFALRDFLIVDSTGAPVIGASSAWILIDLKSRRPKRLESMLSNFVCDPDTHAVDRSPAALAINGTSEYEETVTAQYADMDLNGHVNNARYIDWSFNAMPQTLFGTHEAKTFEINYLAEAVWKDSITVRRMRLSDEAYGIEAYNGTKAVFRSRTDFWPRAAQ
ncbi:MAG: hypothetical protein HZC28_04065 [Spirochaetes bacterium]|nr:hypothetical protein [Spirochaetota bacterium]